MMTQPRHAGGRPPGACLCSSCLRCATLTRLELPTDSLSQGLGFTQVQCSIENIHAMLHLFAEQGLMAIVLYRY